MSITGNKGSSYRRLHICFISPGLLEALTTRGGGIEETNYHVALELSKRSINVTIISTFYGKFKGNIKINKYFTIKEVYLPSHKNYPPTSRFDAFMNFLELLLYSIFVTIEIIRLKKRGLRIVIISDKITGLPSIVASKLMRLKSIFSEGNLYPWVWPYLGDMRVSSFRAFNRALHIAIGRLVCKFSGNIRVQSESIMTKMIELGVNPEKITVINAGVDLEAFAKQNNQNLISEVSSTFKVGFIGRLTPEKGASLLLKVVKTASKALPSVRFFIIGDGPFRKFFEGLPNVDHIGSIPHDMLPALLSNLSAVLFFQKDLGLAVLEAMASEKAVITCNIGQLPKLVRHMENGILCSPNVNSYIEAINLLMQKPSLLRKISSNAREIVSKNFSWNVIGEKWKSLILKTLQENYND